MTKPDKKAVVYVQEPDGRSLLKQMQEGEHDLVILIDHDKETHLFSLIYIWEDMAEMLVQTNIVLRIEYKMTSGIWLCWTPRLADDQVEQLLVILRENGMEVEDHRTSS